MARQYGTYSPNVPCNVTWEESIELLDVDLNPIDLTGFDVRAQIHADEPVRDPDTGLATTPPLIELTTEGFYGAAPDWPISEGWSLPTPTNGTLVLRVPVSDLWLLNPTNEAVVKTVWDVLLVNADGYAIPVVRGRPGFRGGRTL